MLLFANNGGLQTMHQMPGSKMVVASSVSRLTNQVGPQPTVLFVISSHAGSSSNPANTFVPSV